MKDVRPSYRELREKCAACGADTIHRDDGEECRLCETWVVGDLAHDGFFSFRNSCDYQEEIRVIERGSGRGKRLKAEG